MTPNKEKEEINRSIEEKYKEIDTLKKKLDKIEQNEIKSSKNYQKNKQVLDKFVIDYIKPLKNISGKCYSEIFQNNEINNFGFDDMTYDIDSCEQKRIIRIEKIHNIHLIESEIVNLENCLPYYSSLTIEKILDHFQSRIRISIKGDILYSYVLKNKGGDVVYKNITINNKERVTFNQFFKWMKELTEDEYNERYRMIMDYAKPKEMK